MRSLSGLRRRAIVVVALLGAASGTGWAVSSQAFASGTTSGVTSSTSPAPLVPPRPAGAPLKPAATVATNVHCGETITATVTLNGDLYCPGLNSGNALTIHGGSTAITFNLNGHTISSDQSGLCIVAQSPSVIVENGFVSQCGWGVAMEGSKGTVTKLTVSGSVQGIVDFGVGTKVTGNTVSYSGGDGIYAGGLGATYSGNHLSSNYDGIVVGPGVLSVTGNAADSSNDNGIDVVDGGATYSNNSANYNGHDGMNANNQPIIDGGGNTAHGNNYNSTTPEQCSGFACS